MDELPPIKDDRVAQMIATTGSSGFDGLEDDWEKGRPRVLVACPDARPPAYQAAVGLEQVGWLDQFLTGFYHRPDAAAMRLLRGAMPGVARRLERTLRRRFEPRIPGKRVRSAWSFDAGLAIERRLGNPEQAAHRRRVAMWRTERFDRVLARMVERRRPDALFAFSDVGSERALPMCRRLGIPTIVSMVHGEIHEERAVLGREKSRSPELFELYMGDARLDEDELNWLHARRRRDLAGADLLLVPSEHIATKVSQRGFERRRIRVVPYAADIERFRPIVKDDREGCTFMFAGGICQRKGIGDLLQAWQKVRRAGWRLQLLGAAPRKLGPLESLLEGVELLGRVPHAEVPERMAAADVFVFPSLFEGSAVVTYEALACGLPSLVTEAAGSVVRHGTEGLVVPSADPESVARALVQLGEDAELRQRMGRAARTRAEEFTWERYHRGVADAVSSVMTIAH